MTQEAEAKKREEAKQLAEAQSKSHPVDEAETQQMVHDSQLPYSPSPVRPMQALESPSAPMPLARGVSTSALDLAEKEKDQPVAKNDGATELGEEEEEESEEGLTAIDDGDEVCAIEDDLDEPLGTVAYQDNDTLLIESDSDELPPSLPREAIPEEDQNPSVAEPAPPTQGAVNTDEKVSAEPERVTDSLALPDDSQQVAEIVADLQEQVQSEEENTQKPKAAFKVGGGVLRFNHWVLSHEAGIYDGPCEEGHIMKLIYQFAGHRDQSIFANIRLHCSDPRPLPQDRKPVVPLEDMPESLKDQVTKLFRKESGLMSEEEANAEILKARGF